MKTIKLSTRIAFALLVCCSVMTTGCNNSGVERHKLSGKVTYQGKPVVKGSIIFEPDASKGGQGPQGFAAIEDGSYATDKFGRGAISGPLIVRIAGQIETPNGEKKSIPEYTTHIDLPEEASTFDFETSKGSQ